MSSKRFTISGAVADDDFISAAMSATYERGYVAITFYSDAALTTVATPTAGTATINASEDGFVYGTIVNGSIDANTVGPAVQYLRPNWSGSVRFVRVALAGITGATHFKCVISRYEG